MEVTFFIILFVLGACFGSFLCCQARRLHLKTKKGSKRKNLPSRSICFHCGYQLKWYDNLPIISWLALKGRCRKCHKKIGPAEFISELGTALAWLALGTTVLPVFHPDPLTATGPAADFIAATNPFQIPIFIATLLLTLPLIFLAIYDGLYGELPVFALTISIICAILVLTLKTWASISTAGFSYNLITDPLAAIAILAGLYLLLYLISHGKWVGDGDWLLALALALALATPWLALITLFLANLLACLYALPHRRQHRQIHLGPFLVTAFIITLTFATALSGIIE